MGYRAYVKVVFRDGREREYHNVYIKQTGAGFYISKYEDFSDEDFIPATSIDESACRKANPGCFISTAVYHSSDNPEINLRVLKDFRDHTMLNKPLTNCMVELYYRVSPPIADYLRTNKTQSEFIKRHFIDSSVKLINKMNDAKISGDKFLSWIYESCIYVIYSLGLFTSWVLFKTRR
jgi:hypothetical protein